MNIVGIITEHNPFHNGHLYHVRKARQECAADLVVSVMSGHFLQRGEPALFNKWARAEMAVRSGVDLVVELPTAFSVRSASAFALGSISLLDRMGVVTHVCFGSEAGNTDMLWPAARVLAREPVKFKEILSTLLSTGLPYPAARAAALTRHLAQQGVEVTEETFKSPNNILGIEYLKALINTGSSIVPAAIKRFASGYHDREIGTDSAGVDSNNIISDAPASIASATSIRERLISDNNRTDGIAAVVPAASLEVIKREIAGGQGPVYIDNYDRILFYLLRTLSPEYLSLLNDVGEGLENRILEMSLTAGSVRKLLEGIKTKRYTWTRIQRILSYILLGYTRDMADAFEKSGPLYVRVLGLSAQGRASLKNIKKQASVPVITRTSPYLGQGDNVSQMLAFDVRATDIYTLLYPGRIVTRQGLDCKIMPFVK
ncbi:nucleotidyltransferase [Phosphitispora fastidiosa]|uniref:nucleotidyltransferase n=1 Tax=Phosphitispora fastidiosa TaxID=2837202 RepID=UPI001E49AC24|nr:nucleotidyltransferase [Phosphitispora fastidiosa]MBU7005491.1 putative nucleotidyltransferase [Phosphitispora fastidiosa]